MASRMRQPVSRSKTRIISSATSSFFLKYSVSDTLPQSSDMNMVVKYIMQVPSGEHSGQALFRQTVACTWLVLTFFIRSYCLTVSAVS